MGILDRGFEKVKRAGEHLETFKRETDFSNPENPQQPVRPVYELQQQHQPVVTTTGQVVQNPLWFVYKVLEVGDPPPRWDILIGDFAHEIRSALDQLAWQLALHNGKKNPTRDTKFPIATSAEAWDSKQTRKALTDIHPTHRTIIERHQPYKRGQQTAAHPLAIAQNLSNADKHRVPVAVAAGVAEVPMNVLEGVEGLIATLQPEAQVLRPGAELFGFCFPPGPGPKVNVQLTLVAYVAFEDGSRVDGALETIQSYVLDMFREFERIL
jgi:hypothetical protein